jgi:hypothetical protein
MQDQQANEIIQRLTKIEGVLQMIADALNRIAPAAKEREKEETFVFLPRVEPEPPAADPPPGAPPIIKSSRSVLPS